MRILPGERVRQLDPARAVLDVAQVLLADEFEMAGKVPLDDAG
jgi:hypothetical protein